jgi:hypothetical protein
MASGEDRGIVDQSALRMREATFTAGVWLTYVVCGSGTFYVAVTWQRSHRGRPRSRGARLPPAA